MNAKDYVMVKVQKALASSSVLKIEDITIIAQLIRVFVLAYNLKSDLTLAREIKDQEIISKLLQIHQELPASVAFLEAGLGLEQINNLASHEQILTLLEKSLAKITGNTPAKIYSENNSFLPLVITVGGTNGKGTCVTFLRSLLKDLQIVSLTSPHIREYNERILFNGKPIPYQTYGWAIEILEQILAYYLKQTQKADGYFNFSQQNTLLAQLFAYLYRANILIQEVGIGGLYDTTNALDAHIAIITSIGLDHTELLGESLESIAKNKIAIAREAGKVIFVPNLQLLPPELQEQLNFASLHKLDLAEQLYPKSNLEAAYTAYQLLVKIKDLGIEGHSLGYLTRESKYEFSCGEIDFRLRSKASFALALAEQQAKINLPLLKNKDIEGAIKEMNLYGRLSFLSALGKQALVTSINKAYSLELDKVNIILDVAHNPPAVEKSCEILAKKLPEDSYTLFIVAFGKEKDINQCLEKIEQFSLPAQIILVPLEHQYRGVTFTDYQQRVNNFEKLYLASSLDQVLQEITQARTFKEIMNKFVLHTLTLKYKEELLKSNNKSQINLVFMGSFYLLAQLCNDYNFALENKDFRLL
ncbi:Mur ligase family protein [Psittacicella gerlachiana]|nr:Mur ligase family protein [Psittacicella gerlachiana]